MSALLVTLAVVAYIAIAAVTMRVVAWDSEQKGVRDRELRQFGVIGEALPGLAWPIVLPIFLAFALLAGLHALATKGIGKGSR